MTEFTSSDGRIRIAYENHLAERIDIFSALGGENMLDGAPWLSSDEVSALREFFRHESDESLGRWRWPESPDYVVYPAAVQSRVRVFRETGMGDLEWVDRGDQRSYEFCDAARAYFEAHPERKPWHDAKPGEVWVLDIEGTQYAAVREYGVDFKLSNTNLLSPRDERIESGRRIWPEDGS